MAKAVKPPKPPHNGGGGSSIPAPTGLTAAATLNGVYLQWNPVQNATSYWIYRDNYVPAIITNTNYVDTSVIKGVTYVYAIAAVVNQVLGPKSSSVTVTV